MFAILAVNIVGDKLGYCGNLPNGVSKYGISQTQVPDFTIFYLILLISVSPWDTYGQTHM